MPNRDSYDPGTPSWIDLMTTDVDAATAFYTELFGWDAEDQFDDEGTRIYTMFRQDGRDVAGMGGQPPGMDGAPAMWNTYVATDDVDATLAKVEEAGGKIAMPGMDVMTSGRMGMFFDPAGAMLSVWQAGDHPGSGIVNEPNAFAWSELLSRQRDEVSGFYAEVFGWDYEDSDMGPDMGVYRVAQVDGGMVAGLMPMPEAMPEQVPNHWAVYLMVADADETASKAVELGGQVVQDPMTVPGVGRMATLHDPQRGSFMVMAEVDEDT